MTQIKKHYPGLTDSSAFGWAKLWGKDEPILYLVIHKTKLAEMERTYPGFSQTVRSNKGVIFEAGDWTYSLVKQRWFWFLYSCLVDICAMGNGVVRTGMRFGALVLSTGFFVASTKALYQAYRMFSLIEGWRTFADTFDSLFSFLWWRKVFNNAATTCENTAGMNADAKKTIRELANMFERVHGDLNTHALLLNLHMMTESGNFTHADDLFKKLEANLINLDSLKRKSVECLQYLNEKEFLVAQFCAKRLAVDVDEFAVLQEQLAQDVPLTIKSVREEATKRKSAKTPFSGRSVKTKTPPTKQITDEDLLDSFQKVVAQVEMEKQAKAFAEMRSHDLPGMEELQYNGTVLSAALAVVCQTKDVNACLEMGRVVAKTTLEAHALTLQAWENVLTRMVVANVTVDMDKNAKKHNETIIAAKVELAKTATEGINVANQQMLNANFWIGLQTSALAIYTDLHGWKAQLRYGATVVSTTGAAYLIALANAKKRRTAEMAALEQQPKGRGRGRARSKSPAANLMDNPMEASDALTTLAEFASQQPGGTAAQYLAYTSALISTAAQVMDTSTTGAVLNTGSALAPALAITQGVAWMLGFRTYQRQIASFFTPLVMLALELSGSKEFLIQQYNTRGPPSEPLNKYKFKVTMFRIIDSYPIYDKDSVQTGTMCVVSVDVLDEENVLGFDAAGKHTLTFKAPFSFAIQVTPCQLPIDKVRDVDMNISMTHKEAAIVLVAVAEGFLRGVEGMEEVVAPAFIYRALVGYANHVREELAQEKRHVVVEVFGQEVD
jgi:hypothetical protein